MSVRILTGDCREVLHSLESESVHCVVTSPPYWGLRDYGTGGEGIGLEETMAEHLDALVEVFGEVRRVLRPDGTLWLNYGDAYAGSWGAQGRGDKRSEMEIGGRIDGDKRKTLSEQQIIAHPKRRQTGSLTRTGGLKAKDLMGLPWRVAFALQADGWWLRADVIWHKPNPMPESITDRPTKSHEYIFLLAKSERYFYDADAIREGRTQDEDANGFRGGSYVEGEPGPRKVTGNKRIKIPGGWDTGPGGHGTINRQGRTSAQYRDVGVGSNARPAKGCPNEIEALGRNARSVWTIATEAFPEAHFATFPTELAERCIKAGCPVGGTVLDPFGGAGTVGLVADRLQRNAVLIELNHEYAAMAERRINRDAPLFAEVAR